MPFAFGGWGGRELVDNWPKTDQNRTEERSMDEVTAGPGSSGRLRKADSLAIFQPVRRLDSAFPGPGTSHPMF